MSEVVNVDIEGVNLWERMSDSSIEEPTNWIGLSYETDSKLVLFSQGKGGISEAAKKCFKEGVDETPMIILIRGVHLKFDEGYNVDVLVHFLPKSKIGFSRAKIAFHLEFVTSILKIQNFCLVEATEKSDITEQKVLERVIKITGDPTGRYMFDESVLSMRKTLKGSSIGFNIVRKRQVRHFCMRTLYSSMLQKEGGGKFSYNIKTRLHVLTADMKMKYIKHPEGKLKGTYSVMLATVGKVDVKKNPKKKKKKKTLGNYFLSKKQKKKNELVETGGCWFYIQTPRRTFNLFARSEDEADTWLEVLEMVGCRRKDDVDEDSIENKKKKKNIEDDDEVEEEDEDEISNRVLSTTERMLELSEGIQEQRHDSQSPAPVPEGVITPSFMKKDDEKILSHALKVLELQKFADAADKDDVESMKEIVKKKVIQLDDIVRNRRTSISLLRSLEKRRKKPNFKPPPPPTTPRSPQSGRRRKMRFPSSTQRKKPSFKPPPPPPTTTTTTPKNIVSSKSEQEDILLEESGESEEEEMEDDELFQSRESFQGHLSILQELIKLKEETTDEDEEGWGFSTMQYMFSVPMSKKYKNELINRMIEHTKSMKLKKSSALGKPLADACLNQYPYIIQKLVRAGSDVNYRDEASGGDTPLINLAKSFGGDPLKIVKFLVKNGADPCIKNDRGEDFLTIAEFDSSKEKSYRFVSEFVLKKNKK